MRIELAGQQYTHRSLRADAQECVNWYAEVLEPGASTKYCLIGTPGMKKRYQTGVTGGCRGLYTCGAGDRAFAVIGNAMVELMKNDIAVCRGKLQSIDGLVSMADNGLQLIIADGTAGYIYTLKDWTDQQTGKMYQKDVFARIVDGTKKIRVTPADDPVEIESSFPIGSHVVFQDGYFVANKIGTGAFFCSRYYDGEIWDAADYAIAESLPDNLMAIVKVGNELWMFGAQSTEVWFTSGQAFPLARVSGARIDIGTLAKRSPASNSASVYWLGSNIDGNNIVWASTGFTPRRISTHSIENMLNRMARTDDAIGFCYQQEGHHFYVLTFPTGNRTIVYDITTGLWHERGVWQSQYAKYFRHPAIAHCMYNRRNLVGLYNSPDIYEWSLDTHTDNGEPIRSVRTLPHIASGRRRVTYRELTIELETGTALQRTHNIGAVDPAQTGVIQSGQGSDPQLMLQYSNDGGYTWSAEQWGAIGRIGEYKHRVTFRNLGSAYNRTFRLVHTDPVPRVMLYAELTLSNGGAI